MRATTILTAALLLTTLPALASAHVDHSPCGTSQSLVKGAVHVDVWSGACFGATVWTPHAICALDETHVANLHVMALYGGGCQTGILVERALLP